MMNFLNSIQNNPQYPKNVQIPISVFVAIERLWGRDINTLTNEEKEAFDFVHSSLVDKKNRIRSNQTFKQEVLPAQTQKQKQAAYENWNQTKRLDF